jgi:hypothetical protein
MARLTFPNTSQGMADAEAVAQPRHVIWSQARITVLTDADMPEVPKAEDAILTQLQFYNGVLAVGGQVRLAAVEAYVAALMANPASTPKEKLYWKLCNEMQRKEIYIRQLRLDPTFRGSLTAQQSVAEMDNIFLAGSGYEPKMSAG